MISTVLQERSGGICELCETPTKELIPYLVPGSKRNSDEEKVALCGECESRIQEEKIADPNYFSFLSGSIWSEVPTVKVLSRKILQRISGVDWAMDAIQTAYLSEDELAWAEAEEHTLAEKIEHLDAYGVPLEHGDTVFLTENLNVKGTNFTAAKGTKVAKIRLVPDNPEQIEGKIEGTLIVILAKFVRKGK